MDELDLDTASAEEINEIESRLYGMIHHETIVFEDRTGADASDSATASNADLAAPVLLPPPPSKRVITATRVDNRPTNAGGPNSGRYWNKSSSDGPQVSSVSKPFAEAPKPSSSTGAIKKHSPMQSPSATVNWNTPKTPQIKSKPLTPNQGKSQALNFIKLQNDSPPAKSKKPLTPNQGKSQALNFIGSPQKSKKQQPRNDSNLPQKNVAKKGVQQHQQQQRGKGNVIPKGLFGKQSLKLDKLKRIDAKKEKSKLARKHFIDRQKQKPGKHIEFIQLDSSSEECEDEEGHLINDNDNYADDGDEDDVIFVPLSPPKIIELNDDEDDDCEVASIDEKHDEDEANRLKPKEEQPNEEQDKYIEENALDASDVQLDKATISDKSPPECSYATPAKQQLSNSPSSSVLSSDDFIGPNDRRRLNGEFYKNIQADDEDLLLLTADVNSTFLKPHEIEAHAVRAIAALCGAKTYKGSPKKPSTPEAGHDSETEFVPPRNLETIKENYRVEPSQFRALDVYESESDFNECSVYSKSKPNNKSTVIRSVDSSCDDDEDLNDIEIVEANNMQNKTKRLRKRRASSVKDSDSVGHISGTGIATDSDSESDGGVRATGVPFIVHGPAVERCKSRARKLSSHSNSGAKMSDNRFLQSLQNLAKGEQQAMNEESYSESDEETLSQQLPTARDIAERVLKKQKTSTSGDEAMPLETTQNDMVPDSSDDHENQQTSYVVPSSDSEMEVISKGIENVSSEKNSRQSEAAEIEEEAYYAMSSPNYNTQAEYEETQLRLAELSFDKDNYHMNEEMAAFYEMSWGGENFSIDECLNGMSHQRQNWRLQPNDRFPKASYRNTNLKCLNCCEFGHMRSKCKFPKKPIVCSTCGNTGHRETRCPHSICLGCGHRCPLFVRSCNNCSFERRLICPLCKVRGHSINTCPDKWRRYHSTTEQNGQLVSEVKYKRIKHCSICGAIGHLPENCRLTPRFMDYPIISSTIKSHQKVYEDMPNPGHLVSYKVHVPYHFDWSRPLKTDGYYNRMLKAVGLWRRYKRKPPAKVNIEVPEKKLRLLEESYLKNPYAALAQKEREEAEQQTQTLSSTTTDKTDKIDVVSSVEPAPLLEESSSSSLPNQVPEISASGSVVDLVELSDNSQDAVQSVAEDGNISNLQVGEDASNENYGNGNDDNFKMPKALEVDVEGGCGGEGDTNLVSSNLKSSNDSMAIVMDSDSNYSFSEHFEMPSSTTTTNDNILPDIIPLRMNDSDSEDQDLKRPAPHIITGISMCLAGESTLLDRENVADGINLANEVPSEAKIFMLRSDTDYLFSAEGREFLNEISKECNVTVRIDLTSCGYALIITGLPSNQQKLHMLVLKRCKDVRSKSVEFQSQKPPKRADSLIRYLREGICQLFTKLGSAQELYKGFKFNENLNTKNGYKLADKKRRLLNMILLGQAGLCNGSVHLDELLVVLKKLITEYKLSDFIPETIRNQVETHWRMIFTGYEHPDYPNLLQLYKNLNQKNRLTAINIEPWVLGEEHKSGRSANNINMNDGNFQGHKKTSTEADIIPPPPSFLKSQQIGNFNSTNANNNGRGNSSKGNNKSFSCRTSTMPNVSGGGGGSYSTPGKSFGNRQQQKQHHQQQQTNRNINNPWQQSQQQKGQQQHSKTPPCVNPEQRSNANLQLHTLFQQPQNIMNTPNNNRSHGNRGGGRGAGNNTSACMLTANDPNSTTPIKLNDAQQSSVFWSRESMKFINSCIQISSNPAILNGLRRVQIKAQSGQLSQNDYLVVRQLHNTLNGN